MRVCVGHITLSMQTLFLKDLGLNITPAACTLGTRPPPLQDLGMDTLPLIDRLTHYLREQARDLPHLLHLVEICSEVMRKVTRKQQTKPRVKGDAEGDAKSESDVKGWLDKPTVGWDRVLCRCSKI